MFSREKIKQREPSRIVLSLSLLLFISLPSYSAEDNEVINNSLNNNEVSQTNIDHNYQTATLVKLNDQRQISLPSVSRAIKSAKLFSRVSGFIKEQYVDIGDKVNKNDVLAVIDDPQIDAKMQKIMADIANEEAEKELNQLNLTRVEQLADDQLVSDSERDRLRILLKQSNAKIDSLTAELTQNRQQHDLLSIKAPFSGYITERNSEVGDLVSADNPSTNTYLYRIINTERLKIISNIPQSDLQSLRVGDNINAKFTGYGDLVVAGQIKRMAKSVDESTGTMLIEAEFDNSHLNLPAGLRGSVSFDIRKTDTQGNQQTHSQAHQQVYWQAPISALTYYQGDTAIVTVSDERKQLHKINIISQSNQNVVFTASLEKVEKVILNPNSLLFSELASN